MEMAFKIGISPVDFWKMTLRDLTNCINGWTDRVEEERYFQAALTCLKVNVHIAKKHDRIEPEQIVKLRNKKKSKLIDKKTFTEKKKRIKDLIAGKLDDNQRGKTREDKLMIGEIRE